VQWSDHVQGQLRNGVRFRARHRRESDDIQNYRPSVAGIAATRRERRVQEEQDAQREEIAWRSGVGWTKAMRLPERDAPLLWCDA